MTLNGVIALILRFFADFDFFAFQIRRFFTVCQVPVLQCHPYLFSPEKLTTFLLITITFIDFIRVSPLESVTPHLFYVSDLVCPLILCKFAHIFTALHGMQTRSSDENSVRLSVRLSVCLSVCLSNAWIVTKRKKNLSRFVYHEKDHSVFLRRRMVGGGDPFYLKFWVNRPPLERNRRI